jgi:hypothetical protein
MIKTATNPNGTNKMTKQQKALKLEYRLKKIVEHIQSQPAAANFYGMTLEEAKAKHADAYDKI